MIEVMGQRQQALLKLLLRTKSGMTVDELSQKLEVTRNAVRQHLAALENDGLIEPGISRPSGGRPEQLYVLSDKGKEIFPRQYSWLAELVIESIRDESGENELYVRSQDGKGQPQQLTKSADTYYYQSIWSPDSKIDHQECMALGGNICRFKFSPPAKKKAGED